MWWKVKRPFRNWSKYFVSNSLVANMFIFSTGRNCQNFVGTLLFHNTYGKIKIYNQLCILLQGWFCQRQKGGRWTRSCELKSNCVWLWKEVRITT
jgi:hypothetical protein